MRRTPGAHRVTDVRGLDFDDFGAVVAEKLAGEGTGNEVAEFKDSDAGDRSSCEIVRHELIVCNFAESVDAIGLLR